MVEHNTLNVEVSSSSLEDASKYMAQWQRWLNASVLKTESRKRLVGSNPTCVAKKAVQISSEL